MSKYIPYHAESIAKAKELVKDKKDPVEIYSTIVHWVSRNFNYDWIRAITIPKKGREMPDIARCWDKRMGICMDIAAMTVGMLSAVGIKAYMCYGHTERTYHAWVEAIINNKLYRYDHNGKAKKYNREKTFTA